MSEASSESEDEDNGLGTGESVGSHIEESVPGRKKRSRDEVECTGIATGGLFTNYTTLAIELEADRYAMTRVLNLAAPQHSLTGLPRSANVSSNAKTGTASTTTRGACVNIAKEMDDMQKVDKRDLDGPARAVGPASDEEKGGAETDSISSDFSHPSWRHSSPSTLRLTSLASLADATQVPRGRKVSSDYFVQPRSRADEIGCPQAHFSWLMVDLSVLSVEMRSQRIVEEVVAFKTSISNDIDGRYLVEVTDAVERVVRWIHRDSRDSKLFRLYGSLFKALSAYSTRLQCETQTAQLDRCAPFLNEIKWISV